MKNIARAHGDLWKSAVSIDSHPIISENHAIFHNSRNERLVLHSDGNVECTAESTRAWLEKTPTVPRRESAPRVARARQTTADKILADLDAAFDKLTKKANNEY